DVKDVILKNPEIKGALVQNTRQKIDDSYNLEEVITTIKEANSNIKIITDDNYAALQVKKIGNQCGADLGSFSCFKILGPEGVGVLLGNKDLIDKVYSLNYSGGSQVQGHEAMEALRGLVYAPVSLAIQSEVNEELVTRLKSGEIPEIKDAFLANAQSKVLLVELKENIAEEVLELTTKYGAASHPVGSESKYEFVPMMYRVSGTFRAADPTLEKRMIRVNPMRRG
ncbi:aminotransferase class V-fold PLP-dependent enzyme, partial [Clostridium perfringens]|uniref:aminotransferase class V-fold PLP-dependent enzyme n=1 Tax=Clostridium perfringens TaxID=1502 RepID=UPI002AC792BD